MIPPLPLVCFLLAYCSIPGSARAAEPTVDPRELPRFPPVEAGHALSTFRVKPGFHLELVAAEPSVVSPIALSFDEDGRMYVLEMRDYSERRAERLGRVRLLEDTHGDGHFDKSTVFADHLPWPTAIFCYGGGVFVGATPDILYCKDTNGDGVADVQETVFTGFGKGVDRLNVQQLFNSFTWGLDNRIHGATAANGAIITSLKAPSNPPLDLSGHDFSLDPRSLTIAAESGGGQYGLSYDSRGRKFVCSNSSHIQLVMYEERYAARNRNLAMPPVLADIAVDGPAAEVYRVSPDEPWRVIRTRWRVAGLVSGPIEGGGRPSGYFTGATGITLYRGDAWPVAYRDNAFVADCGSNLVHRKKLYTDGAGLRAERPSDEQKVEFLASTDNWFRPVQMANAPDGTLYVIDMYREVIEHPWSLPQSIKKHLDLNSGNDRGRIYRIVPDGFKPRQPPHLASASLSQLVAILAHPNGWHRDTAARLLYERQDRSAVPSLRKMAAASTSPLGRTHALYALEGLRSLRETDILRALGDPDGMVRQHAVRLAEQTLSGSRAPSSVAWRKLRLLASDPDPVVRYQLAFTLGQIDHPERPTALAQVIHRDPDDGWMRAAVLSSSGSVEPKMFELALNDPTVAGSIGGQEFLRQLALLIGAQPSSPAVSRVVDCARQAADDGFAFNLVRSLGEGLQRAGSSLELTGQQDRLAALFARAKEKAIAPETPETLRVLAIQVLGLGPFTQAAPMLLSFFKPTHLEPVQLAVLTALAGFREPRMAEGLLARWPFMTPRLRASAITVLLARPERVAALLASIEDGRVLRVDLSATQIKFLRDHRESTVRQKALQLFGTASSRARQEVVDASLSALKMSGQASRGRSIYLQRCASCHRLARQGYSVGPDLESVRSSGKESLLTNILDPNREVAPKYLNYLVETNDGQSLTGVVASESGASITLRRANGEESVILRSNIERLRSLGQSLMPEGIEAGLQTQDLADLLEYITTAE